jgi:hypothetical protein
MTIVYNGRLNIPNYCCLTTDVVGGALPGAGPGMIVYVSDSKLTYIVRADLQLVEYSLPVSFSGTIDVGSVNIHQQLTESISLAPYYAIKSVSAPGTAVSLMSSATPVISVTIFPKTDNVGTVYIGTSAVDKDTSQQIILTTSSSGVGIDVPLGYTFDLAAFFVDAVNASDGVYFIYFK